MLRTGQSLHPASHPASRRRTGASLLGTLASPRTGLTPAGCPELVDRLRITNAMRPISWAQTNVCSHSIYVDVKPSVIVGVEAWGWSQPAGPALSLVRLPPRHGLRSCEAPI